jgi:hypothetical protein
MSYTIRTWSRRQRLRVVGAVLMGALSLSACSLDGLLKSNELPDNVTDP